ncbi:MAG TPA: ATP-binding protein, partial [Vicinamibacteria bacterium]|nr:ATP-binding protein [Vicinamibacteria bacterium]
EPHQSCACSPVAIRSYQRRVSGPLLDRIDLHVWVGALPFRALHGPPGEPSAAVRSRVLAARETQAGRQSVTRVSTNADLGGAALRVIAAPDAAGERLLETAMTRLGLSGRGHGRVLRVARTLADLEGADRVRASHVAEALQFRGQAPPG